MRLRLLLLLLVLVLLLLLLLLLMGRPLAHNYPRHGELLSCLRSHVLEPNPATCSFHG
jgi:hypothetical protein